MNSMREKKSTEQFLFLPTTHCIHHLHVIFPSIFELKTVENGVVASNKTSEKLISEPTELERRTVRHATVFFFECVYVCARAFAKYHMHGINWCMIAVV